MALIPTTQVNISPDDYKRRIAFALMQEGMKNEPIQAWTQGLAKLAQGALGGYQLYQADEKQKQDESDATQAYLKFLNGGGGSSASATPAVPSEVPAGPVAKALGKPVQMATVDPAAMTGPRPGGPVMPSNKVWGDAEAEAAGLYDRPKSPVAAALANPNAPIQPTPAQTTQVAPTPAPTDAQMSDAKARIAQLLQSSSRAERQLGKSLAEAEIVRGMKPQEYDFKERPDGTMVAINKKNPTDVRIVSAPGGGEAAIKYEADKAAAVAKAKGEAEKSVGAAERQKQQQIVGGIVVDDIDRAIKLVDNSKLPTTGQAGSWLSMVGGTAANDVRALVDTVKANAGFAELQKMRDNSPTGGALGQVSEREIAFLQATIGNLEQSQTADQFKDNLRRVKNAYMDIVHGANGGPAREKLGYKEQAAPKLDGLKKKYGLD